MCERPDFEEASDLITAGQLRTEPLISARYPLERLGKAMDELLAHPEDNL